MLRDAAATIIANRLGYRTDLNADILVEMQLAQETRLERNGKFVPWFLLSEWATATATIGEERIELPDDFLKEAEEYPFQLYDGANWVDLQKVGYDYMFATYPSDDQAQPKQYAIGDGYFYMRPVADQAYSIRMRYYKRGLTLDTNIENVWLKHAPDWLIAATGEVMALQYVKNLEMAATFAEQAQRAAEAVYSLHVEREEINRERIMVA